MAIKKKASTKKARRWSPPRRPTPAGRKRFLDALRRYGSVSAAVPYSGVHRATLYRLRDDDDEFAYGWDVALQEGIGAVEREAIRRAVEGWLEPVYHQGKVVGEILKYSDRMLELLLKGNLPEKYRERREITVPSGVGFGVFKLPDKAPSMKAWMQEAGGENDGGSD